MVTNNDIMMEVYNLDPEGNSEMVKVSKYTSFSI